MHERRALREAEARAAAAAGRAEDERERLAAERVATRRRLDEERDALRRRARDQLAAALAELEQARARGEFPGKRRLAAVRHAALDLPAQPPDPPSPVAAVVAGATVRLLGTSATGAVLRLVGTRVEVQVGDKRLWVEATACEPAGAPTAGHRGEVEIAAAEHPEHEINLIGMTQEEAREALERFLDRALVSGVAHVRVVHGHGTGTLRRVVREVLSTHPAVARFAHPPQYLGGTGVTEAELETR